MHLSSPLDLYKIIFLQFAASREVSPMIAALIIVIKEVDLFPIRFRFSAWSIKLD